MAVRTKVFVDIITKTEKTGANSGLAKYAIALGVATVAIGVATKAVLKFANAASNAEEIGSKYATIFRDMSGEAELMASNFAESFGVANSTSKELLGNTADLLTGLGFTQEGAADLSLQVNTLAADLASFSNFEGGTAGASEALTKALLGEAESAKALGIVINQNTKEYKDSIKYFTEVEGKTLLQAKAFTALKFATEQSGNAIGDVSRTWDSAANVSKRLKEQTKGLEEAIGYNLSPAVTAIKSVLGGWAEAITEVLTETRNLKEALKIVSEGGNTTAEQTTLILQSQVDKLGKIAAAYEMMDDEANKAYENAKRNLASYNEALTLSEDSFVTAERAKQAAILETQAAEDARNKLSKTALEELAQLQWDALTPQEQEITTIQQQIDKWAKLRDVAGAQELINELVKKRNELQAEGNELSDKENESAKEKIDIIEDEITAYTDLEIAAMAFYENEDEEIYQIACYHHLQELLKMLEKVIKL